MKKNNSPLIRDVETLVEQTVTQEATDEVWKHFETALSKMDPESIELLNEFFAGTTTAELSRRWRLSEPEMEAWLKQKRKELVQNLRTGVQVRQ